MMPSPSAYEGEHRERLSALVDGELDAAGLSAACACWIGQAEARRDWHAWQLAGDVLRSEDLASDAERDALFLAAVRERLAREPVVLAPAGRSAVLPLRRARWWIPASIAAGFFLVVGTYTTLLGPGREQSSPAVALDSQAAAAAADPLLHAAALSSDGGEAARVAGMPVEVVDGRLVRDPRLERYLAAHKQFAGTSALGVPSAFLRGATVDTPAR